MMTTTTRAGDLIQRWYCSDCQCEHEASVIGGATTKETVVSKEQWQLDQMRGLFEETHHEGATEFGGLWLAANESAVNRVPHLWDTNDIRIKTLMSLSILMTLRTYRGRLQEANESPLLPPLESPPLRSLVEVESERVELEDYDAN